MVLKWEFVESEMMGKDKASAPLTRYPESQGAWRLVCPS